MNDSIEGLKHKIEGAQQLSSVVRTMKALAASSIGQYERAVYALKDYYRTVELGIVACLRQKSDRLATPARPANGVYAVIFGSDQGLVGQFNEQLAQFALHALAALPGDKTISVVGERMQSDMQDRVQDKGRTLFKMYEVPGSVSAITSLVTQILMDFQQNDKGGEKAFYIYHHRSVAGSLYEPVGQCLLPFDILGAEKKGELQWPSKNPPEVIGNYADVLRSLLHEYLFVSLYKACAESLVSENASRMAAMQRAEKNIDEMLEELGRTFHLLRQNSIDEELFDVLSGFEALSKERKKR